MERRLGKIKHVYHEAIDSSDDGGLKTLDDMNPAISGFVRTLCRSGATMEATEDRALLEESTDWQRCLTIGLMSEKVLKLASDGYQESTKLRYEHIARRIDTTLGENESGALFIGQDHRSAVPNGRPGLLRLAAEPGRVPPLGRGADAGRRAAYGQRTGRLALLALALRQALQPLDEVVDDLRPNLVGHALVFVIFGRIAPLSQKVD